MKKLVYLNVVLLVTIASATTAFAQKRDYKPGEKLECRTSTWKDEWEKCTFVEPSYGDGLQPIIRDALGFQKGMPNWDWVRPAPAVEAPPLVFAQKRDYKPGEKIECKTSTWKDEWEKCTFVEPSYGDGLQPIIRDALGFQKGMPNWDWVRPVKENAAKPADDNNRDADVGPIRREGDGLMSQADVLNFLKTNMGANPLANPRREAIKAELAEEIKRRGLDFHAQGASDFFNQLGNYGAGTTDISFPLNDNYGSPTKLSWLVGTWRLDIVGATTEYEKRGDIYRKEASAAANVGKLTINADGTYLWRANAPVTTFQGQWRKATAAEMMSQGGDGIVLLAAKSGWDWIVTQLRGSTIMKGDVIYISYINGRGVREIGSR